MELKLAFGLVEQHPIQVLDGSGFEVEQFHGGLHGLPDRSEEEQTQAFPGRQRDDLEFRRSDGGQRALAATQEMIEIVRLARATVQRISRPALKQTSRQALVNFQGMEIEQV